MTTTDRKLHQDTEEVHSNTHPDLNPLAFSHHHHKGDDRTEEEKQNQPSTEGRKEARKEGLRKEDAKAVFSHHPRP